MLLLLAFFFEAPSSTQQGHDILTLMEAASLTALIPYARTTVETMIFIDNIPTLSRPGAIAAFSFFFAILRRGQISKLRSAATPTVRIG